MYMLGFLDHLPRGCTAQTTIQIPERLEKFGVFTRWLYREKDTPEILKQTLYHGGYRENDHHTAKTPFRVPRKRPLPRSWEMRDLGEITGLWELSAIYAHSSGEIY